MDNDNYCPGTMLNFITMLYKKYKILKQLSQQQSNQFQSEVISMLIDENQNINQSVYKQMHKGIGIPTFVLEVLANVIDHNKNTNSKVKRQVANITQQLDKKWIQLNKRIKIVDRKEQSLHQRQIGLKRKIQEHINLLQKQSIAKLIAKEKQVRNNINNLISEVRSKQKVLGFWIESIKTQNKKKEERDLQEQRINEKAKQIERKDKELKITCKEKQTTNQQYRRQLKEYRDQNDKMSKQIEQMNKRIKNQAMAYRKVKQQLLRKQQKIAQLQINLEKEKVKQSVQRLNQAKCKDTKLQENILMQELDISSIDIMKLENNCKITSIFKQINSMLQKQTSISKIILDKMKQLQHLLIIAMSKCVQNSEEQDQSLLFLKVSSKDLMEDNNNQQTMIEKMSEIQFKSGTQKLHFLSSDDNIFKNMLIKCIENSYQTEHCTIILKLLLQLLEKGEHYTEIIEKLSTDQHIQFLQQTYLRHQTQQDIANITTLALSRIKMMKKIQLSCKFLKAIELRLKVQDNNSLLSYNIKSLKI